MSVSEGGWGDGRSCRTETHGRSRAESSASREWVMDSKGACFEHALLRAMCAIRVCPPRPPNPRPLFIPTLTVDGCNFAPKVEVLLNNIRSVSVLLPKGHAIAWEAPVSLPSIPALLGLNMRVMIADNLLVGLSESARDSLQ